MVAATVAMLGVLTGLVRIVSGCDSAVGVEGGGVGLVSVTAGGRFAVAVGDLGFCDALEPLL